MVLRESPRRAATIFIFITIALDMIAMGMIIPILPKLVASFLGGNLGTAAEWVGIFATVWALMQLLCSPLLGMLSDRIGRRPVILLSNAVTVVDYVIMALAPNLWWLFAGRMLSGMASANIGTAYAYITDITVPEKRAAAFGLLSSAFGLGFILGPAIGGLAGNVEPRLAFWLAAGLSLVNTLYGFLVLPESLPRFGRSVKLAWKRANPFGSLKLLRSHPELFGLTGVQLLLYVAHQAYPTLAVLYCIAAFGWDARSIGLAFALVGVCGTLSSALLVGPVVKRFGERKTLLGAIAFGTVNYLLSGAGNGILYLLAIVLYCMAIYNAPLQALMSRRVGPSEQGELQGAIGSVRSIAMLIGPGIFSTMFALFVGPWHNMHLLGAPFLFAALLWIIAFVIALRVTTRSDDAIVDIPAPAAQTLVEA